MKAKLSLLLAAFSFSLLTGFIRVVTVPSDNKFQVSRWSIWSPPDKKAKVKAFKDPLARAALYQSLQAWDDCAREAHRASSVPNLVRDWTLIIELGCAQQLVDPDYSGKAKNGGQIALQALRNAIDHPGWYRDLYTNPRIERAIQALRLQTALWLGRHNQFKEAKLLLNKVFADEHEYSVQDRVKAYEFAGEMLVGDRVFESAFLQFDRARQLMPDSDAATKIKNLMPFLSESVRKRLEGSQNETNAASASPTPLAQASPIPSVEEMEVTAESETFLSRGETGPAIEALEKLLKNYPGGLKSKWAQDKLFELYVKELNRSQSPNGTSVNKGKIEKVLLGFDGDRLYDWGRQLFDALDYADAYTLLVKSASNLDGSLRAARSFLLAARSAQLSGKMDEAKDAYKNLTKKYGGTPEFIDGSIQWGLVSYEAGEFSDAIVHFEAARARKLGPQQDLISLYWLLQAQLEKKNKDLADKSAAELVERFPLTLYGLQAAQYLNGRLPSFQSQSQPYRRSLKLTLSLEEAQRLDRAKVLMQMGLLSAAGEELSIFNRPFSQDENIFFTQINAQSLRYPQAFAILNTLFDQNPALRTPQFLKIYFPREFYDLVMGEGRKTGIDPLLLLSVMRQESAFNAEAVSRSGAIGLLQMIPPTADEVGKELGAKVDLPNALYDPVTNVRFAAHYLSRLIKKYDGVVPLALAAYNVGPTRITAWVRAKIGRALSDQSPVPYSKIYQNIWIDELPWAEPSYYVKSILKNHLAYRILYERLAQVPDPIWQSSPSSSPNP